MRRFFVIAGIVTLAALWLGPLPWRAAHSFAAHMTLHMGVVAVAAGFLGIGLSGGRLDLARRAPRLVSPIPTSVLELLVVWAWHAPALHHFARHSMPGLVIEQAMFLGSGFLVWNSAFGGSPAQSAARAGAGIAGLLLTSMHMTLLGALLALTPRVLYGHASHGGVLAPLDDQHLGGAIMLITGGVSYLLGGLWLTAGVLRRREVEVVP